jgi:CubicO group peptidase (beta-lactamase class C family)
VFALAGSAEARSGHTTYGRRDPLSGRPPSGILPGGAFDQYMRGLAEKDQFSGSVLLAWRGHPVLARSYQMADKAARVPNTSDTSFALGSITKFFTGLAIVQLAAQDKVSFSATLGTYLDGFPSSIANKVTVHQLLTHTSGVEDFMSSATWRNESSGWKTTTAAFNGTLSTLRALPLTFTPGTQYQYCNSNYFLAGAIVAAVSGESFWDYLAGHVFARAGMSQSGFFTDQQWLNDPRVARNYSARLADGTRQDVTRDLVAIGPPSNGWDGAGGAFSSATDMLRFANALQDGTLLDATWASIIADGKYPISAADHNPDQAPSKCTLIGYGSEERIVGGERAYGHTGGLGVLTKGASIPGGGSTSLSIYPDLGIVAIVLSNYFLYPGIGGLLSEQDGIITGRASG